MSRTSGRVPPDSTHIDINDTWTTKDMIEFNRRLIDERKIRCQWVDHGTCNEIVQGKDFTAHLHHKHLTSDSQLYSCRWEECSSAPMKKSSLGRHVTEQHAPVKWYCPRCPLRFTRENKLIEHLGRMHGDA